MAVVKKIKTIFQFKRDTTQNWELNGNTVPAAGEPCYDLDLGTLKIGDGVTTYANLKAIGGAVLSEDGELIVENLQADLDELKELIGETSVEDRIAEALADVPSAADMEQVVTNISEIESKTNVFYVDIQELQSITEQHTATVTEIQTIVEKKADAETVEALQDVVEQKADAETVTVLQTVVEQKADVETVTELQTIVEQKVDTEAVETMGTELKTYIDEQIRLVEIGNYDGGVIE